MSGLDTADLALLALAGDDPDGDPDEYSVVELDERLEMGAETMADRISLLSTLSELEDRGMVAERTAEGRTVYALTDRGRNRAAALYDAVTDREIEVRDGDAETVALGEVDRYLPEPAVARALARLTEDDVLYLRERVDREFVDREAERASLEAALEATRAGDGRALLVTGPAGVGKTTLVEEFLADAGDARVLAGVARGETDRPYRAVREAIEELGGSPFVRHDLDVSDPDDLESLRTSLFADVADTLLDSGARTPVVLYIDDLDDAGRPTLELVEFLARRVREGRVLVVATARTGAVDDDHPIHDLAADWSAHDAHGRIDLSAFDREHTRALTAATLGTRRLPSSFVDLVYEHTGGTPLFVVESLSRMQELGVLAPDHDDFPTDPDELPVSGSVEATIETRLDVLDEDGRAVLSTAALVGEVVDVAVLSAAVEVPAATVRTYLDVLVDAGVLGWVEEGTRVRFRSGLFRRTVVDRLPDDRRGDYHDRIAAALADHRPAPEHAASVAYHHERAGNSEQALDAWLRAAEHAESVYAQELAREHYEHALALARDLDDDEQVLDALEAIGDIEQLVGEFDAARRTFEYVRDAATSVERTQRVARKISEHQRNWAGEPGAALETVDRALALTDGDPSTAEECRLLIARGDAAVRLGDHERGRRDLEAAADLAADLGDRALRAEALGDLVGHRAVQEMGGVDEDLVEVAEEVVAIREDLGDDAKLAEAYNTLGLVYTTTGDPEGAREATGRALELSRSVGDRSGALTNQVNLTMEPFLAALNGDGSVRAAASKLAAATAEARDLGSDAALGVATTRRASLDWQGTYSYGAAVDRLERALELFEGIDRHRRAVVAACFLAWVGRDAGEFDRARPHAERAVELGRRTERSTFWSAGHRLLGDLELAAGDPAAAIDQYEEAVSVAADGEDRQAEVFARAGLVEGLLVAGRSDDAAAQANRIRTALDDGGAVAARGYFQAVAKPTIAGRAALGRVARERGEFDAALDEFETALERAREDDDRLREARLLLEVGATHRERGDSEAARDAVERAGSITVDLGAFGEAVERAYADVIDRA